MLNFRHVMRNSTSRTGNNSWQETDDSHRERYKIQGMRLTPFDCAEGLRGTWYYVLRTTPVGTFASLPALDHHIHNGTTPCRYLEPHSTTKNTVDVLMSDARCPLAF
jgi:hypothetical protein